MTPLDPSPGLRLELHLHPWRLAVCRLARETTWPRWAAGPLVAVVRTPDELSVVCNEAAVPPGVRYEGGWRVFEVEGPLALAEVGILARLASDLAAAGVALCALSTFDTDWLLVREAKGEEAVRALRAAGHRVAIEEPR